MGLNFHDDKRNLTLEQLRAKSELLFEELKSLGTRAEQAAQGKGQFTSDQSRRISDIDDWITESKKPADNSQPSGMDSIMEGGFNFPSAGEKRDKDIQFGRFLQAMVCADRPAGSRVGGLETGRIYRNILDSEARSTGNEESTPSLGGFTVATDQSSEILTAAYGGSKAFAPTRKINISAGANGIKIPISDSTSRADASRPVRGYWTEEGSSLTQSTPKFGSLQMSLFKLSILVYTTEELLLDSKALGAWMSKEISNEISFKLDDAIINGTGSGQPLGIMNAACLVSQAKETGQVKNTLVWENVKKIFARLHSGSYAGARFLINQDVLPELYSLSNPVGTGGVPVYLPSGGASTRAYSTLLGLPVDVCEACQTIGTTGDIILWNPLDYICITKGDLQMAMSHDVAFTTDEVVFKAIFRVNGQPTWSSALTPFKGATNTQSIAVALASRD